MKRNTLTAWLLGIILIFSATSCFNGPIVKGSKNYITKKENLEHFNDISMSGSANITSKTPPPASRFTVRTIS